MGPWDETTRLNPDDFIVNYTGCWDLKDDGIRLTEVSPMTKAYVSYGEMYHKEEKMDTLDEIMKKIAKACNKAQIKSFIKNVIFSNPATIVIWADGSKTVVKAKNEDYDPEKGLAMAIAKKFLGNEGWYYDIFKKWLPEEDNV